MKAHAWSTRWARSWRRPSMQRFDGAVAVVTGGGQGIGAGIAPALAAEGAAIVGGARTGERIEKGAPENRDGGGKGSALRCQSTDAANARSPARGASPAAG